MNWIDKLERKYGRFGIQNLTMYVIICYVVGYVLVYINPSLLSMMSLEPVLILHGQIWRIITWVIYPPSTTSFLWFICLFLLSDWYIAGTYLGKVSIYIIYFFRNFIFCDRSFYFVFHNRSLWNRIFV